MFIDTVKFGIIVLQNVLSKTKILAQIRAKKCNILSKYPSFTFSLASDLSTKPPFCTSLAFYLAFGSPFFASPKKRFLVVKTHFLHHFSVQKHVTRLSNFGQKASLQSAKCSTLFCVLLHFTLRFAGDSTAFCMS